MSHQVIEQSRSTRERSQTLLRDAAAHHRRLLQLLGESLSVLTELADRDRRLLQERRDRLAHFGAAVGRDPGIENAKSVLRDRYGINGQEAFELIRAVSQRGNRKARDVARDIVAGSRDAESRRRPA
jgi:hypothetical protein